MSQNNQHSIASIALDFINHSYQNIFLTGGAGTGKTTFLKFLKRYTHKKMVIAAPIGVAAVNAGGITIHSLFGLPPRPLDTLTVKNIHLAGQSKTLSGEPVKNRKTPLGVRYKEAGIESSFASLFKFISI